MADKTITSIANTVATIATAGTIVADRIQVIFDETTEPTIVVEQLEKAKNLYLDFMSDKA